MSDTEHTPTPWLIERGPTGCRINSSERDTDGRNRSVALTAGDGSSYPATVNEANAEFIVRACNTHDDLLAACKEILPHCKSTGYLLSGAMRLQHDQRVARASAIIAKATKVSTT